MNTKEAKPIYTQEDNVGDKLLRKMGEGIAKEECQRLIEELKKGDLEMTKEEIEQYIDLDNKIKNRIVQVSHALHGVNSSSITAITPNVKQCFSNELFDKEDFIENSNGDSTLHIGLDCYYDYGDWNVCHIDKNVLCLTDKRINEIVEYDSKVKEEIKFQKEAEKARRERLKKEVEEKEYEQYLRLKKKFES